jgi:two-component system, NarL family, sensor histidine kinase DegS
MSMRISGSLKSALDAVGEPILLVSTDAQIAHRNRCAMKHAAFAARTHLAQGEEPVAPDVLDFLTRCGRSTRFLRGSLSLRPGPSTEAITLRCEGSRVRLGDDRRYLVLLRVLPANGTDRPDRPRASDRDRTRRLVQQARLHERTRIARDLHDQAGQQVLGLKLGLSRFRRTCRGAAETAELDRLIGQVDGVVGELQRTITDLRPPPLAELGLGQALRDLTEQWTATSGIPIDFEILGAPEFLTSQAETALFRLLQEALTNVAKHAAGVRTVAITLRHAPGRTTLTIRDDGAGLSRAAEPAPARGGKFGLIGMQERIACLGGELELRSPSERGQGTAIVAHVRTGSRP